MEDARAHAQMRDCNVHRHWECMHSRALDMQHAGKRAGDGSVEKAGWGGSVEVIFLPPRLYGCQFPALPGSRMTLWNDSLPFYPGANACFPFDTSWAIIISVFLSLLATFIIILPGIRGRGVSGGAGGPQPYGPCPVHPTCFLLPGLENRFAEQTCPQVHGQGSGISSKLWG